jgi:hypothetical protein
MNSVIDNSLVGLALLVSAGYALLSLGPRSLRRRLLAASSRATAFLGLRRTAGRLSAASAGKAHGACGGCDSCGSDQPPTTEGPAAEVRVPVGKIGRRV